MRRRTLFLMGLAGAAGCARDRRPRLNVFNWSNYVAPDTIPGFEREFGVHVRYAIYESNEEMLARVMSGNSGWDVVFPSNYYIRPMREYGLLAPVDQGLLPNLVNLEPEFRAPEWDPKLEHCVPYMWSGTGIAFHRSLEPAPRAWEDMWNPHWQGRMTMLDDAVEVFGAALKKLGYSLNSTRPEELGKAQQEAIEQKELLRAYINAEVTDHVVAGDVLAAQLWSTTAQQAIAASKQVDFVFPADGFLLYHDNAVILRESRRRELAHTFLNYLLRPDVAAGIVTATRTATANAAARRLLPLSIREDPKLYPPPEVMARGEWAQAATPELQRLRDRLWTEVKAA